MGRVTVPIRVENSVDFALREQNPDADILVRSVELEALVDTCASLLCLPTSKIQTLGLSKLGARRVTTANGEVDRNIYGNARLTALNRTCTVDVIELLEETPALLGYIPLENLDLIPEPTTETLKPAHGDDIVLDLY